MATATYRGIIRDGKVELLEQVTLAAGTEVVVTPSASAAGTSAAVLSALEDSPPVPEEWVDDLDALIAEGRRPANRIDPFAEHP